jgi:hypothetical protein
VSKLSQRSSPSTSSPAEPGAGVDPLSSVWLAMSEHAAKLLATQPHPGVARMVARAHPTCKKFDGYSLDDDELRDAFKALPPVCHLEACRMFVEQQGRGNFEASLTDDWDTTRCACKLLPLVPKLRRLSIDD